MDYKIIEAHNVPPKDEEGVATLHITLEIEGMECHIGGLPVKWGEKEVKEYIEKRYDKLLRKAQDDATLNTGKSEQRPDLLEVSSKVV